jgi:hypothetical protein
VRDGGAELLPDREGHPLPTSLGGAIADRLGFLSPETLQVLRAASLLGTAFGLSELSPYSIGPPIW